MKLFSLRAAQPPKIPNPEPKAFLHEDLARSLRQYAKGLLHLHGDNGGATGIRRAANRLEEMEMILNLVAQTTKDAATKSLVQEAMADLE